MANPKLKFLEDKEKRKAHTALINSAAFEEGVIYAMADYASDCPSAEQLIGANRFLSRFIHLAESEEEPENTLSAPKLTPPEKLVPES